MNSKSHLKHYHSKPILEELESRQLFSGGIEGLLTEQLMAPNATYANATPPADTQQPPAQTSASETSRNEIVFVDTRVQGYESLLNDIKSSDVSNRNLEIITLDSSTDGIQQITQILAERDNLDAVHIISHGSDGSLDLGNSQLNFDTLIQNQTDISAWGDAFNTDGDILIYGCNVAETQFGQSFVDYLSGITNIDVAASEDTTGSADLGGDWLLEYQTGDVETEVVVSAAGQSEWTGLMAVTANGTVTSTSSTSTNQLTWSHTVSAGFDRVLFVEIAIDDGSAGVNSVKYGTADLTRVGRTAANHAVEIWALVNPTAGTDNVVISFTGNTEAAAGASTFNGVNQSMPYGTYAGNTGTTGLLGGSGTVNVASATGDLVIDVQYWKAISADTTGTGQTSQWSSSPLLSTAKAGSSVAEGASSVTMSGSALLAADWSIGAVSIKASINTAPVNTVPAAQTTNEDTAKVFSSANGNAITITDADAGGANNEITLTVTNGTLTLGGTTGLTFAAGDGTADNTMRFRGTASAINTALNGLSFTPTAEYSGSATLTLATKDSVLLSLDIDTGLLGRYAFDNTSALETDSSPAAGSTASVVNGTSVNDTTRGNVLSLAGDGYVQTTGVYGQPSSVTLAAWVNLTSADTGGAEVISLGDNVILRLDAGGKIKGSYVDSSTFRFTETATTLAGTGWHHVAYTIDSVAHTQAVYIDGVAVASTAYTTSIAYSQGTNSFIGKHGNGGTTYDFNGKIDEARIYNRALTGAEIAALAGDLTLTDTDTVAITVTAVNDAPLISAIEATTLAYTENGTATEITSGLVLTEVDNANLSSATVQISGNYASGQDVLAFTDQNGITGSWNASTGTLTLTGTATVSQYQTALRSVTYQNTSDAPSTASRTVSFSVTDGTTASNIGTRSISVAAVNDAPVLSFATGSVSYPENAGAVILAPTATVTDADSTDFNGGQLVVSFSANGQAEDRLAIRNQGTASGQIGVSGSNVSYGGVVMGTFTGGTDGTTPLVISFNSNASVAAAQALGRNITYQNVSDAPSNLVRTLQGYLTDGDGGTSNVVSGTLSIIASNDAPVVTSASLTLSEGQTVTLSAANFGVTDPDNNSFTYTVSNVSGGIFQLTTNPDFNINSFTSTQLSNNQVQFVDDGNEVAPSFSVAVSDGSANSNTLAATINYTAANEAPTDIAATRYLSEQSYLTKSMYDLTLDTGHSGYGIVLDGVSYARGLGTHPAASGNGYGYVDYAVNGATSFKATIGINDYQTGSYGKVQFYVYVDGVQTYSSPILNSTSTPIDLNIDVTGASTLRLAIDNANNGNAFDHGVWANARLEGGTVALASIAENTAIGTVVGSVVGVDNDLRENWSYALINDAGGRFAINANTGQITVANDSLLNYEAATSHDILIRATDTGGLSVDKTFTISLADVNEAPVISSASLTLNEGDTVTLSSANFGVSDPDNTSFTYTVSSVSGGYFQLSSAAGNSITQFTSADLSGGLVQFVDDGNEVAPSFSVTVNDGALNSNTLAATIHYTAVNDNTPVISSGSSASINENSPINTVVYTATGSDADGNPMTWSLSGTDAGLLTIDANSGAVTLNAFADYESKSSYSFDVVASDGTLSSSQAVTLAVANLNDNPVSAISDSNATANSIAENAANGTMMGITALASDADTGATISYSLTDNAGGRFAIDSSTGVVTVADSSLLDYESATSHSITVLATSSDGSTNSQSFTINVANLNDNAPVLSAPNLTLSEGQTVTLNTADFVVSDADSSDFTFTISALTGGYFQLTTTPGIAITSFTGAQLVANQVQFVDDANEAPPNFNATASDGTLNSNTLAATINYSSLNDVPVLTSASLTLNEGETVTLSAANFGVTDPDNASVTYALSSVSGGYFQLTTNPDVSVTSFNSTQLAAGQVQFVDDSNEVAPRFDVTVSDGSLSSNTLSATIYYTGINDAPIINNLGLTVSEGETVTLSAAHFGITDPDSDSFTYTVGDVTGGYFQLASRAGLPITGFTSAQLTANQVQFIDDGNNESAPSFSLSVNDGLAGSTAMAAKINYIASNDTTNTLHDIIRYNPKNGLNDKNQGDDAQTHISASQHVSTDQFAVIVDLTPHADQLTHESPPDKQATDNRFILESNAWIDNGNSPRLSGLMDTNKNEEPRRNETSRKYHFESRIPSVDEYRIDSQTTLSEQEEVEFWNRLENIHKQMSDPTVVEDANPVNIKIILGTSAGLTAGFVSWILRAGSLMASFMSTVPLLKRFDPLPIMRSVKKSRLAKDHEAKQLDSVSSGSEDTP